MDDKEKRIRTGWVGLRRKGKVGGLDRTGDRFEVLCSM